MIAITHYQTATPAADSGLWQEFVFFYDCRDGHSAIGMTILYTDDSSFALNSNAFREGDLRRERERECDWGTLRNGRFQVEADAAGADIAQLGEFARSCLVTVYSNWDAKSEPSCSPFLLLGFGHASSKWRLKVAL